MSLVMILISMPYLVRSGWAQTNTQESHPGLGAEVRFAEAVIAYHRNQTDETLKILDELLSNDPKKREYLEMKALVLKDTKAPEKSLDVYLKLYETAAAGEQAPYAFEIATLLAQQNKMDDAAPYFQKAIDLDFNVAVSSFYLGLNLFQKANYVAAEKYLEVAADSQLMPFSVIGRYYLGICFFKLKSATLAIQELVDVRTQSRDAKSGDPVFAIAEATDKMLVPFSSGHWFGNLLLQSQYDSNIQQLPAGAVNQNGSSNPSTLKMMLSGGGGYMSAPVDPIQWVANYRAGYNYNFNSDTKSFEYFTNNASLYLNYRTLEKTSGGLKLESSFVFQNSLVDPTQLNGSYQYQKYNSTVGGGPYFRHQLNREWKLEAEVGLTSQHFYIDPRLTGTRYHANVLVQDDRRSQYFNPGASLLFEKNDTQGSQYLYSDIGIGLMNSMKFVGSISVIAEIDWMSTHYSQAVPIRSDQNFTFKLSGTKLLSDHYSLLCDLNYLTNSSNLASAYSYHQFTSSLGMGYSF